VSGRGLVLAALVLVWGCGSAGPTRTHSAADYVNTQLSPELAQWLVGAVSHMATPEQVQEYLAIRDDATARTFIDKFWEERDPDPSKPGNPLREIFEQREAEADRRFSEAGYLGRRTDRGTIFVLFGEPDKIDFEIAPHPGTPPIELWDYSKKRQQATGGAHAPAPVYRFVKRGDLTVLYRVPVAPAAPLNPSPGR
jgi:GWxTD domain-containing protein